MAERKIKRRFEQEKPPSEENPLKEMRYRRLRGKYFVRLALTYVLPAVALSAFFVYRYVKLGVESSEQKLAIIAESQAKALDLFLQERIWAMLNLVDASDMHPGPNDREIKEYFGRLRQTGDSFIDLGIFDSTGVQTNYYGPEVFLLNKNYKKEKWFQTLISEEKDRYVITDVYLGLRGTPHFTIAAGCDIDDCFLAAKSSLNPASMYQYITSFEKSTDKNIAIVNSEGVYQLVSERVGNPTEQSPFSIDSGKTSGFGVTNFDDRKERFAFYKLATADWYAVASDKRLSDDAENSLIISLIVSFLVIGIFLGVVAWRSKAAAIMQYEKDVARMELDHAAKLAAVGELSSGIAHEIGNPLNIIASIVGVLQEYADPRHKLDKKVSDIQPQLEKILLAVKRIKEINEKLLRFVRKSDEDVRPRDVRTIIDDFVDVFFEREMSFRNIDVIRDYESRPLLAEIDENGFKQVIINLLNNAADAIGDSPGEIAIRAGTLDEKIFISVADTGSGISEEAMDKIMIPFYTTKPVGKGTGLGLSISLSIIRRFGGEMEAESILGEGSVFIIRLPKAERKGES